MKAAVMHDLRDMRIEEVEIPEIGAYDVLVRMRRVGICGSDVHFYLEGRIADFIVKSPLILGHECSGEVAEIGSKVERFGIGERVVVEPGFTCGKCEFCRRGRYNLCRTVKFYATPPFDGAFAEYVSAPEQSVLKLPDNITHEEGAMIEPLAVGMMAAKRGEISASDSVAIFGAGPIGQMSLLAAKVFGALEIYVVDVVKYRLEYAEKSGATDVVNSSVEDPIQRILNLTANKGIDVVMEASGALPAIKQALEIVKPGGRIIHIGYPMKEIPINLDTVLAKELDLRGVHRYANVYPTAIKAVSLGKINVRPFVTHRFPLDRIVEGFETQINRTGNSMKVQIVI